MVFILGFGAIRVDAAMTLYGTFNTGSTRLSGPSGVYVTNGGIDNGGNLYVVEYGSSHIYMFASTGGTALASQSNLNSLFPMQIAQDSAGNIYVAANSGSKIVKYNANLSSPSTFISTSGPNGVAIDAQGNVYVTTAQKVKIFDSSGTQTATRNATSPQLASNAMQIALDGSSDFYVADFGNARIQKFTATSDSTFASSGLANPSGLAVDSAGNVYLADAGNNRIKKYDSSGTLLETYSTGINIPRGIFVDRNHKIYIGNTGTNTIIILSQEPIHPFSVSATPSGASVILNWTNSSSNITSTVIVRNSSNYPTTTSDGTVISSDASGTSYTDSDLGAGTYYYGLFAQDTTGAYSTVPGTANATVVDATPPAAPSAATGSVSSRSVSVAWINPTDSDFVSLIIARSSTGYPTSPTESSGNVTATISSPNHTYSDTVPSDGPYYYALFAVDQSGNYSASATFSVLVDTTAPSEPTLTAEKNSLNSNTIMLSWTHPDGTDHYLMTRFNGESTATFSASIPSATVTSADSDVADGSYIYSIYAIDSFENTSNVGVSSTINIDTVAPSAPNAFSATASGNQMILSWTNPVRDFDSVIVCRSTSHYPTSISDGTVVTTNSTATSFSLSNLEDGIYYFSIFATDSGGNVSVKSTANATIDTTAPAAPTRISATVVNRVVQLSWTLPMDSDFHSITIRKSRDPLATRLSGTLLAANITQSSLSDSDIESGTTHYSFTSRDQSGNWSVSATISATVTVTDEEFLANGILDQGTLTITQNNSASIENTVIGSNGNATANFEAIVKTHNLSLGDTSGVSGVLNLTESISSWQESGSAFVGNLGTGVVNQDSGSVNITGSLVLGNASGSSGIYRLQGGTLNTASLQIGHLGSGEFNWTGGTLTVPNVIGDLTNLGGRLRIYSAYPMTITGNYTQSGSGAITFVLQATNNALARSGTEINSVQPMLKSSNTINLSGTVALELNGYTATPGDRIRLVNAPTFQSSSIRTRSAIAFDLPTLESRLQWDTSSFSTDGTIRVVSTSTGLINGRPLNYPNPFKLDSGTRVGYFLSEDADIEIRIYSSFGSEVFKKTFKSGVDDGAKAGYNLVLFDGGTLGKDLPAGVYPYVLIHKRGIVGRGKFVVVP